MVNKLSDIRLVRTQMMLGSCSMQKLKSSKVAIFGLGGVGSAAFESLVRCGVGNIDIFDGDLVDITNINRQLIATTENVGKRKVSVAKDRALSINPYVNITPYDCFFDRSNEKNFDFSIYDYIIDAIDMVSSKLLIISKAKESDVQIISSMGTGNKMNPSMLEVADVYRTSVCPLARVMRRELKKLDIKSLKVVYSKEPVMPIVENKLVPSCGVKIVNSSVSFVPSVAGFIMASEVVKSLIK